MKTQGKPMGKPYQDKKKPTRKTTPQKPVRGSPLGFESQGTERPFKRLSGMAQFPTTGNRYRKGYFPASEHRTLSRCIKASCAESATDAHPEHPLFSDRTNWLHTLLVGWQPRQLHYT